MRGLVLLLTLVVTGCPPADPQPPAPGEAPALPGDPPPPVRVEVTPPTLPAPPSGQPSLGTSPACPAGMLALAGGPATLGEDDAAILRKHSPNTVVPRGDYVVAPFCIDTYPLPGTAGASWPTDGLNKPQIRETVEPWLWGQGRRLCTVSELMFAAGGAEGLRFPWGNTRKDGVCDPKDEAPDPMGSFPKCESPTGAREFQVRSTWARLDATTLAALSAAGADTQPGFDGGYTVWGGLVRADTYYAPTNSGVHFHQDDAPAFNDDGLRTCAWSGAVSGEQQATWDAAMKELSASRLLAGLGVTKGSP